MEGDDVVVQRLAIVEKADLRSGVSAGSEAIAERSPPLAPLSVAVGRGSVTRPVGVTVGLMSSASARSIVFLNPRQLNACLEVAFAAGFQHAAVGRDDAGQERQGE